MRQRLSRRFPAGSFARNVGVLTGGTVFAQGLAVLSLPLLTRLYSPDDFSLLAVYSAVIGIVTVVSCLRYNIAIPLPEEDADAMALLVVALGAGVAVSILLALPVLFAPEATAAFLGQPDLTPYLWMIPLGVLFASTYNALQYWATRKKRFGEVARTRVTQSLGSVGAQVGFGFGGLAPFGLLFGGMVSQGLGFFRLACSLARDMREGLEWPDRPFVWSRAKVYRRFPVLSVPEALMNTAGLQLPVIIIAAVSVGPEAGFLMLAMRVMAMPTRLLGASVAQAFYADAPRAYREGRLPSFSFKTMRRLALFSAPVFAVIACVVPVSAGFIFGTEWERAGLLILWMTPWFFLQFVTAPVSVVLHVCGRLEVALALQTIGCGFRIASVVVSHAFFPGWEVFSFVASSSIFYLFFLIVVFSLLRLDKTSAG